MRSQLTYLLQSPSQPLTQVTRRRGLGGRPDPAALRIGWQAPRDHSVPRSNGDPDHSRGIERDSLRLRNTHSRSGTPDDGNFFSSQMNARNRRSRHSSRSRSASPRALGPSSRSSDRRRSASPNIQNYSARSRSHSHSYGRSRSHTRSRAHSQSSGAPPQRRSSRRRSPSTDTASSPTRPMTSRGVYIPHLLEGRPARNVKSYTPNTARFLAATASMIEVRMCTKRAVPTGDERDEDVLWALKAVKTETGEQYELQSGTRTYVSCMSLLNLTFLNFIIISWRTNTPEYARMLIIMPRPLYLHHTSSIVCLRAK